jgi:hypothetical protein
MRMIMAQVDVQRTRASHNYADYLTVVVLPKIENAEA